MKYLNLLLLVISTLFSINSYAYCTGSGYGIVTDTINFANVKVQRDTPNGTVIATSYHAAGRRQIGYCDTAGGYQYEEMMGNSTPYSHVYTTNVPGVGVRVLYWDKYYAEKPATSQYQTYMNLYDGVNYSNTTIELVKIGEITSGPLNNALVSRVYYSSSPSISNMTLYITGSVTVVACSITTSNVNVPLDPVLVSSFTGVNSTKGDKPFTIGLSCDAGARINASLSFDQNTDTSNTSVIKLTGAGSAGVATGVGIQLLYGSTPLQRNTNIVLKTSSGGQEFPAGAFTARYFQTKSTVTTGDANATATLNLTYQ